MGGQEINIFVLVNDVFFQLAMLCWDCISSVREGQS